MFFESPFHSSQRIQLFLFALQCITISTSFCCSRITRNYSILILHCNINKYLNFFPLGVFLYYDSFRVRSVSCTTPRSFTHKSQKKSSQNWNRDHPRHCVRTQKKAQAFLIFSATLRKQLKCGGCKMKQERYDRM
ncbi:unnamed protein product [Amoebophrya sp. A120]|nr:unnamed protein product [Amoebophrya sp. A120]|eukprot:GSA120T00017722001.1